MRSPFWFVSCCVLCCGLCPPPDPDHQAWVVERFGKFHAVLEPGLSLLIPVIDEIKYVHSLKEIVIEIPSQVCAVCRVPCAVYRVPCAVRRALCAV